MTHNEYSSYINELKNNLIKTSSPLLNIQNQLLETFKPISDMQDELVKTFKSVLNFQDQLADILKPISSMQSQLIQYAFSGLNLQDVLIQQLNFSSIISETLNSSISDSINRQSKILSKLQDAKIDTFSTHISHEFSDVFKEISLDIIAEIDNIPCLNNISETKEVIPQVSKHKGLLTWEQILAIITFIITIISFIQNQLPNQELLKIENSLQKLIEIQSQEVELLKKVE